jgi:DNA-binding MarR family transcriptional regulator
MDAYSTVPEVARALGVSPDRVRRAAQRSGLQLARAGSSRRAAMLLSPSQREEIASLIGSVPHVSVLSEIEALVLTALARAPRGVTSRRALARRAGVSPTSAGRAVGQLEERGLVTRRPELVAHGSAQEVEVLHANRRSATWPLVAHVPVQTVPRRVAEPTPKRVPNELLHLFWNTHWNQLQLDGAAGYVARRIASSNDLDALAWASRHLDSDAWAHAAHTRGLSPRRRRLVENLALEAAS